MRRWGSKGASRLCNGKESRGYDLYPIQNPIADCDPMNNEMHYSRLSQMRRLIPVLLNWFPITNLQRHSTTVQHWSRSSPHRTIHCIPDLPTFSDLICPVFQVLSTGIQQAGGAHGRPYHRGRRFGTDRTTVIVFNYGKRCHPSRKGGV